MRISRGDVAVFLSIPGLLVGVYLYPYMPHTRYGLCAFRMLTGIKCPSCGVLHSMASMVHGDLHAALKHNPVGPFVLATLILFFLHMVYVRVRGWPYIPDQPSAVMLFFSHRVWGRVGALLVIGLFVQWAFYLFREVFQGI